ncbi:MAG: Rrf2 family transcriptional regulator [Oscillospiraceae bacterium]|nr:Rrf2 family transcriptional regulator [Oscillospiraceae bacterium]
MFISRECDYAFRIIRALTSAKRLSIQHICDAECIPHAYAYKIIKKLADAELVKVFRGVKGGYELSCDPDKATLYDVYHAIEGDLFLNDCQKPDSICPMRDAEEPCHVHKALWGLQEQIVTLMNQQTIRSIL